MKSPGQPGSATSAAGHFTKPPVGKTGLCGLGSAPDGRWQVCQASQKTQVDTECAPAFCRVLEGRLGFMRLRCKGQVCCAYPQGVENRSFLNHEGMKIC